MNKAEFLNLARGLFNIDGWQLPELTPDEAHAFVCDPLRYFMCASDFKSNAIWRELEKRQRLSTARELAP